MLPAVFDDKAHVILTEVFDAAETNLIRSGMCKPEQADDYLTVAYIVRSGDFLENGGAYIESEGRIAADLFLFDLPKNKAKSRYMRIHRKCALQLHWHTHYYFRNYHTILCQYYLWLLRTLPDLEAIDRNGVLQLAAATLPEVRTEIRRERRRRGAERDRLIVSDDIMKRRTDNTQQFINTNSINFGEMLNLINENRRNRHIDN